MKWFHHEVDSMHSEKIAALIAEFGFEGYGRYWRIMEIVAERMDGSGRFWAELPMELWLRYLSVRRPLFNRYLVVIQLLFDIKVVSTGLLLRIEIPNLLKWQDNYTKDLVEKRKKLLSKEREIEIDIEKNKTHIANSPKNGNSSACEKVEIPKVKKPKPEPAENEKWFLEDWDSYPRKAGNRKKALACYLKTVKTETDRQAFQQKMKSYIASVRDEQFLKHGETFFRNWLELEVGDEINADERVRKRDKHEADKKAELDRLEKYKQLLLETLANEPDEFLSHKLSETEAAIESVKNWTADF